MIMIFIHSIIPGDEVKRKNNGLFKQKNILELKKKISFLLYMLNSIFNEFFATMDRLASCGMNNLQLNELCRRLVCKEDCCSQHRERLFVHDWKLETTYILR